MCTLASHAAHAEAAAAKPPMMPSAPTRTAVALPVEARICRWLLEIQDRSGSSRARTSATCVHAVSTRLSAIRSDWLVRHARDTTYITRRALEMTERVPEPNWWMRFCSLTCVAAYQKRLTVAKARLLDISYDGQYDPVLSSGRAA
jgi:hypothetical protein